MGTSGPLAYLEPNPLDVKVLVRQSIVKIPDSLNNFSQICGKSTNYLKFIVFPLAIYGQLSLMTTKL